MNDNTISNVRDIEAMARKPFVFKDSNGNEFIADVSGYDISSTEEYLPRPRRKKGAVILHDVDSFILFAKRFGNPEESVIYIDADYAAGDISATAIFNDHSSDNTGWRDHRAKFSPRFTAEWKKWTAINKTKMSQHDLGIFLESNIADIVCPEGSGFPTGSDILGFVTNLQEIRKVTYGKQTNLQNGMVAIAFTEEGDKGTQGRLEVFKEFCIGIRPFHNSSAYPIKAYLRYRIDRNSGDIVFWYELQRPERFLEDACAEMVKAIQENSGLPVVFGC